MKEHLELVNKSQEVRNRDNFAEVPNASSFNHNNDGTEDEAHLLDYWRSVRKRLWLVVGTTVLFTMLIAVYMTRKPDIYEAQARVQVDLENTSPVFGNQKNGSVIVSSPVNDPAYFNTQLQILTGPGLLRRVVKTLDVEGNPELIKPSSMQNRGVWQNALRVVGLDSKDEQFAKSQAGDAVPLISTVSSATTREDMMEAKRLAPYVKELRKELRVDPVKETRLPIRDTRLIDIRYSHTDPQAAARIINTIADVFVVSNREKRTQTNSTAGEFLQQRIAELQAQIRSGEERLISYAKSNEILSLDTNQNTVVERLAGLNRQLLEAENERKLAEAAYRAGLMPGAAGALAEGAIVRTIEVETKLADLQQKRAQLTVDNTEEWPEVEEINDQIAALEAHIEKSRGRAISVVTMNLGTRYRQSLAREQSLRAAFDRQRGETLTQNEAAINYRIIQQEITTNKSLLDGLLQRSKENDVVLAGTPNNIDVVDYAIAPDEAIGPKRLRGVTLALVLSLAFGIGLALFLEYMDDTVRSADDIENMLRLPTLAIIPSVVGLTRRRLLPGVGGAQARSGNDHPELLINGDARSLLSEAYRQLRTSVLLATAGRAPKTLLVTSSLPSEGKTTTAVNTAVSLAQTGVRVLMIDADMRRPRIHSVFEVENRNGLSTILSSEMGETEVLQTIKQHEATNLFLLTSGPLPPNPAELLGSEQMRRLITILEANFTHVVIDSPPVSSITDGVLVSSLVDGVLLVVHGGKSSRAVVRRSRQLLQNVGAKIFGVVLNNVNLSSPDYYYQGYYKSAYYTANANGDGLASGTR